MRSWTRWCFIRAIRAFAWRVFCSPSKRRDVKTRLADDGVFVMSNYYRQGWIVGRLVKMAEKVFDTEPMVLSLPYAASIKAADTLEYGRFNVILVGKKGSKTIESIRKKFQADQFFWLNRRTAR